MAAVYETVENWGLKKCGEITTLLSIGKEEFFLSCEFCDYTALQLDSFIYHMCENHLLEFNRSTIAQKSTEFTAQLQEEEVCNKWENSDEEINEKDYDLRGFERVEIELDALDIEGSLGMKEEEISGDEFISDGDYESQAGIATEDADMSEANCYDNKFLNSDKARRDERERKYWDTDKKFVIELIKLYRSLPSLWNTKHQDYKNQSLRKREYDVLLAKYKERYPRANRYDVLKRINNLRSCYRRELKRSNSGSSTLYYFDAMDFLRTGEINDQPQSEMGEDTKPSFDVEEDDDARREDSKTKMCGFGETSHPRSTQEKEQEIKQKFIIELIELYQSLPALWNIKSSDYNDRELKNIQYRILLEKYKERYPNAGKIELKKKISSLRANFRRHLQREYPNSLYYFNAMRFLCNIDESQSEMHDFDNMQHCFKDEYDDWMAEHVYKSDSNAEIGDYDGCNDGHTLENDEESVENDESTPEQKFIFEFISAYRSLPALWDVKNANYHNRAVKNKQYEKLLVKFRERFPDAVKNDLKRKINSLRSNFRREAKRKSITGLTNLFYYDAMTFLFSNYEDSESQSKKHALDAMEQSFNEEEDDLPSEAEDKSDSNGEIDDYDEGNEDHILRNDEESVENDESTPERQFIFELISVYRSLPALWDVKSDLYHNRAVKNKQFGKLLAKFRERFPDAVKDDLKRKINSLRSSFRRETKRKFKTGSTNLFYYDAMSFLLSNYPNSKTCDLGGIEQNLEEGAGGVKHLEGFVESDYYSEYEKTGHYLHMDTEDDVTQNSNEGEDDKSTNEKDFTIQLIQLYRSLPSLWNIKDKHYYDRKFKKQDYEILLRKYNERYPDADMNDLKKKINGIRCNYRRELKRIHPYGVSTLYYFDAISFLRSNELRSESPMTINKFTRTETTTGPIIKQFTRENSRLNDAEFIDLANLYKIHPCLWDETDIAYRFANRRREAMADILENFNTKSELNLTKSDLEKEISELRKICSFEKKKSLLCKKSKTIYKPSCPYYDHIAYLEVDVRPFECQVCGDVIPGVQQYKVHLASHDGSLPYKCTICGHGFQLPSNLAVHCRRHVQDYTYSCEICNKPCATTTELKTHMSFHTGEKPYVCDICGKNFRWLREFKEHMQRHEKRPGYKCEICSKPFYKKSKVKEHMSVHTKVRDKICNVCNKGFSNRKQLRQHKYIHDEEKKFICKICGKRFAQSAGLSGHVKSHGTSLFVKNADPK